VSPTALQEPRAKTGSRVQQTAARLQAKVGERVIGLEEVTDQVLIALFTRSHALLEGVPGLAKTMLLATVARLLDLTFARIQFTPDLMPSDITGSEYLVQDQASGQREFRFASGPVFSNVVLADEINRAPPKTQAALIEAMEERQVTTLGVTRRLDEPFLVLATQNPLELQGTYALPAAQLDRFLFKIRIGYPTYADEEKIARLVTLPADEGPGPILAKDDLLAIREEVGRVEVPKPLVRWAVELAHASRPQTSQVPEVKDYVEWGVGPRAAQGLVLAAKARALLRGRDRPDHEDLAAMAPAVFRHRLILSYAAEADGVGPDDLVRALLERVPPPGAPPRPTRRRWWERLLSLVVSVRPRDRRPRDGRAK
jgi:MoxR-like ATPase